jgi:hypothetical protein
MDGHVVVLPKFEFLWLSDFVTSFRDRALGTAKSCNAATLGYSNQSVDTHELGGLLVRVTGHL